VFQSDHRLYDLDLHVIEKLSEYNDYIFRLFFHTNLQGWIQHDLVGGVLCQLQGRREVGGANFLMGTYFFPENLFVEQ
jgi:hypothetical protein